MKFVLVHGAWHRGELWQPVRDVLESQGHEVHTPTIGGFAPGCNKADFQNLDKATAPVLSYILERNLTDYVLLGHSFGGLIISKVALKLNGTKNEPIRIIYQNAMVAADGQSVSTLFSAPDVGDGKKLDEPSDDNTIMLPFEHFRAFFINHGSDELAKEVYDKLSAHPSGQFVSPVDMKGFDKIKAAKSYILGDDDLCLENGVGVAKEKWKVMAPKLQGPYNLVRISPADHEVMFTNPELLAEKILEASNGGGEQCAAGAVVL